MPNEPTLPVCSFYSPASASPFRLPPSLPLFFNSVMSEVEQLVLKAIHLQLNQAISTNLSTGITYGMPPHPYCFLSVFIFHRRTPDHPSLPAFRDVPRHVLHLNQDTSVRARAFHSQIDTSPAQTLKLSLLAPSCSSKGPLFHALGHMFLFGTSTIIFILSTIVIVLGPALMSQRIRIIIKIIDPSLNGIWPPHKSDIVNGIIVAITRLNARFPLSFM